MSVHSLARQFVDLCNQGRNFDVMEAMYAADIVSVEASGIEVAGKEPVIEKSRKWAAVNTIHGERVLGPYFDRPDNREATSGVFAVHFSFEVTPKSTGKRTTLDEVGVYTVKNDKIVREQFYFEGTR